MNNIEEDLDKLKLTLHQLKNSVNSEIENTLRIIKILEYDLKKGDKK